ncbi:MAG: tol-pal system-associated acyl-CoA thioesterase [Burkholderiaceae bacterium]|nr:tol-pal system-associated acyl-CoA thioesterase [Burkholderiaceae bacterium]
MTEAGGEADPPFSHRLRVYWEDTDAGGVVFYANYLKFFERARTEWLRALGVGQQRLRDDTGVIFIVTDTALRYLAPARLDDELDITVRPAEAGRASLTLQQQAWRHNGGAAATLLCEGTIRIGCVAAGSFRPVRFPTQISRALSR